MSMSEANDPRNVSTDGLNASLADAVAVIRDTILAASDVQRAYPAGQNLAELVEQLKRLQ
jgi:hypothetical protein